MVNQLLLKDHRKRPGIAEIMGYEISKSMSYHEIEVESPLGVSREFKLTDEPVLITILRAGLAMHNGLLRTFDRCDSAFVSAYREHTTPEEFEIHVEYNMRLFIVL